jgi:hypothetical protein
METFSLKSIGIPISVRHRLFWLVLLFIPLLLSESALCRQGMGIDTSMKKLEIGKAVSAWLARRGIGKEPQNQVPRDLDISLIAEDVLSLSQTLVEFYSVKVDTFKMDVALVFMDSAFLKSHVTMAEMNGRQGEAGLLDLINSIITKLDVDLKNDSLVFCASMLPIELDFPRTHRQAVLTDWKGIPMAFSQGSEPDSVFEKYDEDDLISWLYQNDTTFVLPKNGSLSKPFIARSNDTTKVGYYFWSVSRKRFRYQRMMFIKGQLNWMATGPASKKYGLESWGR